jgi:PsbP
VSTQQPPPPYGPPPPGPPPPGRPYPPYGPPPTAPRKSNRALIAVIVIVALVVAGGAVGGGLLLLGSDSDSGESLEGDGYSYTIPDDWSDQTSETNAEGIDSVVKANNDDDGFFANVFVEIDAAEGVTDVAEIQEEWATNTAESVNATPESIDDITIDGEDAVGIRLETTAQGIDVVQVAYLAVKDDKAYSIVLSSNADAEDHATEKLDGLLNSWSWQSAEGNA